MTDQERVLNRLKTAIKVLLVVFIISFIALAARIVYVSFYADWGATTVVPDNIIEAAKTEAKGVSEAGLLVLSRQDGGNVPTETEVLCEKPMTVLALDAGRTEATVLELYLGHPNDNESFQATNMLPGDTVTKYYCLKVYHKADAAVFFHVTDVTETRALGDVLRIKVTRIDTPEMQVLCDGSFSEIKDQIFQTICTANADNETTAYYRIDVTLPTSAGNEYQGASLSVDFNWYAENPDPAHVCESRCPICGRCLDLRCTETACARKCKGHGGGYSHECESKCEICGKCLDPYCLVPVCEAKCEGHTPDHVCESVCEVCGKCRDLACEDPACAEKCTGHTEPPPAHVCESKCEICGKCRDLTCEDPACAEKCEGHGGGPGIHICESKCEICGKCRDLTCENPECAEKCEGHGGGPGIHICEHECEICEKCRDLECTSPVCAEKCPGHGSPLIPRFPKKYLIWPWMIVPALSLVSMIILIIIYFRKKKEDDDGEQ